MQPFSKGLFSDFVKLVLFFPSRNTDLGALYTCKCIGQKTKTLNESEKMGSRKASPLTDRDL
jgi:hypothetical protein